MKSDQAKYFLAILALAAILTAGALYADKVYVPPEAPPNIVYTIKGPVILYDDANPGEIITAPNLGTIYYLNQDKKRVVFPEEMTFLSWYADYSQLKHIPLEVLESYPLSGRNATIRPGTYLVTIPTSHQVWAIGHPNDVHWLVGGEEQVVALYGDKWSKRLVDIQEYYFVNYHQTEDISGNSTFPIGTLIHANSNDQFYVITGLGQRQISEQGVFENNFQVGFAIEREEPLDLPLSGPPIDSYEAKWGSPDIGEQMADRGPEEIDTGGSVVEEG